MTQKSFSGNFSLFSKIAHELRAPIHGINGLSSYLYDNWDRLDDSARKSCIASVVQAGNSIQDLIDNLFQLSSVETGELIFNFELIDVVYIIKKTIDEINSFIIGDNNVRVVLESSAKKINLVIDKFWINRLLCNLLNNAQRHSGAKNIKVSIKEMKEKVIISVIDDGVGIPQNELETIFMPFAQSTSTKNSAKGSGLGLAICRQIVTEHKGEISANNNPEGGAIISFDLLKPTETYHAHKD